MSDYRRSAFNAFYLVLVQSANYIVPLAIMFHLNKSVGVSAFGLYAFWYAVMLYAQAFLDYGFSFSGTREVAAVQSNTSQLSSLFSEVTLCKLWLAVLLAAGAGATWLCMGAELEPLPYVMLASVLASLVPNWFFQGLEQLKALSLITVLGRIMFLAMVFLTIDASSSIADLFKLHCIAVLPPLFFGYRWSFKKVGGIRFASWSSLARQFRQGWNLFQTTMLSMLLSNGGLLWLGMAASPTVLGIYASIERLIKAIVGIFIPISQACYPMNSRRFAQSFPEGLRSVSITGCAMLLLCVLGVTVFYYTRSIWMAMLTVPEEAERYVAPLLGWVVCSVLNNVLGIQTLSAAGFSSRYAYSFNAAACVFVGLIVLQWSPDPGQVVASALLIAELFLMVLLAVNVAMLCAKYRTKF